MTKLIITDAEKALLIEALSLAIEKYDEVGLFDDAETANVLRVRVKYPGWEHPCDEACGEDRVGCGKADGTYPCPYD
jgi:hypothetical protein